MAQPQMRKSFQGLGNLVKLLPTGTVFFFQFFNLVLTENRQCSLMSKIFSGVLLGVCGLSCAFSCFTDSYPGSDGQVYHGIVTAKGLWPLSDPNSSTADLSSYRLRLGDFVHAFLSVLVFAVVSLGSYTVSCLFPSSFESNQKLLFVALPPAIGVVASAAFIIFPNNRRGVGYPCSLCYPVSSSTFAS